VNTNLLHKCHKFIISNCAGTVLTFSAVLLKSLNTFALLVIDACVVSAVVSLFLTVFAAFLFSRIIACFTARCT